MAVRRGSGVKGTRTDQCTPRSPVVHAGDPRLWRALQRRSIRPQHVKTLGSESLFRRLAPRGGGTLRFPLRVALGIVSILLIVPAVPAQTDRANGNDEPPRASAAPRFDGLDFGGVNLPAPPQRFNLVLSAARAWAWKDRHTSRLMLDRDVRVQIGPHIFEARRAVIWMEPILIGDEEGDQVAIVLDQGHSPLTSPLSDARTMIEGESDRLLVTAVLVNNQIRLRTDRLDKSRPRHAFVEQAEQRLVRFLEAESSTVDAPDSEPADAPDESPGPEPHLQDPDLPAPGGANQTRPSGPDAPSTTAGSPRFILPESGLVYFSGPDTQLIVRGDEGERAAVLTGGIVVQHQPTGAAPPLQLTAERAVVFLGSAARAGLFSYAAEDVEGVYLEGDVVATNGEYTLRGRRVFYDVRTSRAIVLDAVFWTFDQQRGMPLYMRADAIRQESQSQWSASAVRLTNVGFAEPHFSIGADRITLTRVERDDGPARNMVDAEGVGFMVGDASVIGLPRVRGEFKPTPLRRIDFASEGGDPIIRTEWDLYTILGIDASSDDRASLLIDGYLDRGVGVGLDLAWNEPDIAGSLLGYFIHDNGTDRLTTGERIDRDDDNRGLILAEQAWRLDERWTLFLEGSYISDEAFLDAFFESEAETRREIVSSAYLRYLDENSALTIEARGTFNDFIANEYLLQSQGYQVEKLPEATYRRFSDNIFGGLVSYSSEYGIARMNMSFSENELREQGFKKRRQSEAGFGLLPTDSIGDALRAAGLNEDAVTRFDTRHEFEIPLRAGAINIVPFAVGRFTAYDTDFESFNGDPDADKHRLWGSVGARASTSFVRVDNSVQSDFFDLDRIRHIVEPYVTVWYADSTLDSEKLPVFDDDVEALSEGFSTRFGVRNTWQTMRGPEGSKRSVDWLVVSTDLIWSSSDTTERSPYGRFIDARPELSRLGRFFSNQAVMNMTDAVSLVSTVLVNTDTGDTARLSGGAIIDHGFGFSTFGEYRWLDEPDAEVAIGGVRYELTRKYSLTSRIVWDIENDRFQSVGAVIERRFPQWTVDVAFDVDRIADDFSVGVALRPVGFSGEDRRRIYTRDQETGVLTRTITPPTRGRVDFGPFAED